MTLTIRDRQAEDRLHERILAAFPAGHYALDTFFRLSDVVISEEVSSAAVECLTAPRMLLNPAFVAKYCKTDEYLFMLVMHELHHVLLGHTRLFRRITIIDNIVFDAVINALLSQLFQQPVYFSFFQNIYKPDRLPDCLLRPPPGWPEAWYIPGNLPARVRELIRVLYSPASGTYKEVYDLLIQEKVIVQMLTGNGIANPEVGEGNYDSEGTFLLGDHSPEDTPGRGESAANHPALNGVVRGIVEKWPQPPDPIRGRSVGSDLREIFLKQVKQPPAAARVLKRMIRKMVEADKDGGTYRRSIQYDEHQIEAPLPTLRDRRAFVASTLGWAPLVYRRVIPERRLKREAGMTTVYVDVSGSTRQYWEVLASLVRPYVQRGVVRLFAFSEVTEEISPAQLAKGRFNTTGGTDATCIWKNALENGFKKIVLLTDGYVGRPTHYWQGKVKDAKVRIRTALTPEGYLPDLEGIAEEIVELPAL